MDGLVLWMLEGKNGNMFGKVLVERLVYFY